MYIKTKNTEYKNIVYIKIDDVESIITALESGMTIAYAIPMENIEYISTECILSSDDLINIALNNRGSK